MKINKINELIANICHYEKYIYHKKTMLYDLFVNNSIGKRVRLMEYFEKFIFVIDF